MHISVIFMGLQYILNDKRKVQRVYGLIYFVKERRENKNNSIKALSNIQNQLIKMIKRMKAGVGARIIIM